VQGQFTLDCFTRHVMSEVNQGLLKAGWRAFFEADFKHDKTYRAPFAPEDSLSLELPSANSWTLAGGIGGNLPSSGTVQGTRIDLAAGYVHASKEGARSDQRAWVSLTHTHKLADRFSLLSGFEWSDKPEFKNEVTSRLRARFGVRYKVVESDPAK
jgi:hypothetical protein